MQRESISTPRAPQAIGTYSQAIRTGDTVYISGQIPLDPLTGQMVTGGMEQQIRQSFNNLAAVAQAAGGSLAGTVKLTVYLVDMEDFPLLNRIMAEYFSAPYPARAVIGAARLPRDSRIEVDAILVLRDQSGSSKVHD
jgi:reactive intermediate/imine deaminase